MPLTVAISTARRAWWWTRRATFRRAIPETWNDVPVSRRRRYLSWWLESPEGALERVARDALRLPGWAWRAMGSESKAALLDKFRWTEPKPDCEDMPLASFRYKRRTYLLPKPKFQNGTCLDFALADDYLKMWTETGDPVWLLRLTATLCREPKRNLKAALTTGDDRVPLQQKEEVEHRAALLDGLPPAIMVTVMFYFMGVKEYITRVYWMLFDAPPPNSGDDGPPIEEKTEKADEPKFGLWSVFMQVAETGIFGQYEEVLQRRLHLVFIFLVDQQDRNEITKRAYERERSKSKT